MATFKAITAAKLAHCTVDFDGTPVVFTFNVNAVTLDWADTLENTKGPEEAAEVLLQVIRAWDIVTDDGEPEPLRAEHLRQLPAWAFQELQKAILNTALPSRAEKNESSQRSSEKPSTQDSVPLSTSPNGSETLPSPTSSAAQSPI